MEVDDCDQDDGSLTPPQTRLIQMETDMSSVLSGRYCQVSGQTR